MTTTEQVDVARLARLRALQWLADRPASVFVNAYSVSVWGGYDGEAEITVQGKTGRTQHARDYLGVTSEPQAVLGGRSRWTHHVGQPGEGVRLVFVEDPA